MTPLQNRRAGWLGLVLLVALLLAGCSSENQELEDWMKDVRKDMRPVDTTVSEPKLYVPYLYSGRSEAQPFDPAKVTAALAKQAQRSRSPLSPNLDRRREPLEAFPLDTIAMVGVLETPRLRLGLLRVGGMLYQVKVGNYVGQNYGMITQVSETGVSLKEVVQDATGDWVERISMLQLQERK